MRTIKGLIQLDIYPTEDGFVALKQPPRNGRDDCICLLSVDQLPDVIRELETLYSRRRAWAEVARE